MDADGLTHLDARGGARMVDVGAKDVAERTAVASCTVILAPATAALLADGELPKGDALALVPGSEHKGTVGDDAPGLGPGVAVVIATSNGWSKNPRLTEKLVSRTKSRRT